MVVALAVVLYAPIVSAETAPTITWSEPAPITYGTALSSTQLNATASVAGTFTYTPAAGTVLAGGTDALSVIFTPTDRADYGTVAAWVPISVTGGTEPSIQTIAGNGTAAYAGDSGLATSASLNNPNGIAFDSAGNLYIADGANWRVRKVAATTGIITTVAGSGVGAVSGLGGPATAAKIGTAAVAVDSAGNLYIAGGITYYLYKVDATTGVVTAIAGNGTSGYSGDGGLAVDAEIGGSAAIAVDSAGNVYYTDSNEVVRKITASTGIITTVAGNGTGGFSGDGGAATSAELSGPDGVAVDAFGNLYIADQYNYRVRKVTASTGIITTVAGSDAISLYASHYVGDGGSALNAGIYWSEGVAVDSAGNLYISDKNGQRIRKVTASTGMITTIAGDGVLGYSGNGGPATNAELDLPSGVAVSPSGNIYFSDTANQRVRAVGLFAKPVITWPTPAAITFGTALSPTQLDATTTTPGTFTYTPAAGTVPAAGTDALSVIFTPSDPSNYSSVTAWVPLSVTGGSPPSIVTVAGNGTAGTAGDSGAATSAELNGPDGLVFDAAGNLYVADANNGRVRKVSASTGIITTVAGGGTEPATSITGSTLATQVDLVGIGPAGLAMDSAGNLYLGGVYYVIKVTASTGVISILAGNGIDGYTGDGGPATSAEVGRIAGTAVDSAGNVYIADLYNAVVRKITASTGIITTVAGTGVGGFSGDGVLAITTKLSGPDGVAVDSAGNVYIADQYNERIREVNASTGIITTVAGSDLYSLYGGTYVGDGGPATGADIWWAEGVAVDSAGNIYISDKNSGRIREVNASTGIITTIAGNGTLGYSGNGGPATNAESLYPTAIALSPAGKVYFSDTGNNRVRALTGTLQKPTVTWVTPASISYGTVLSATQLDATASVAGTFTYSPAAGTLEKPGTYTLSVLFTPTDVLDYASVTATTTLTVTGTVPTITSISPSSGNHGSTVTITGTGFGTSGTLTFNGVTATTSSWSATTIIAVVPSTATTGNVIVTPTGGGPSSGTPFTVTGIYDSGTVSLMIDGVTVMASYGQGSTACTVAASLISAFNAVSGASVTLSAGTCTSTTAPILVTSKTDGSSTDYLYSVTATSNANQSSFSGSDTSGTLSGGSDGNTSTGTTYSYSITSTSGASGYAPNGNLTAFTDSVNGTWSFSYDTLNRLIAGFNPTSSSPYQYYCWAYDAFGNRTLQSNQNAPLATGDTCEATNGVTNAITMVNSNNQISQTNVNGVTWTPAYDAAGNLQSDGANQYLYDGEGRVCAVMASNPAGGGAVMTQYIYDAEGNRVAKGIISTFSCNTASNGFSLTASYILGPSGEQVTELDGSGNFKHTNVYANGSLIATYDNNGSSADPTPIHFHLGDWLGTRRVQTSYNGTVEASFQGMPFGDGLIANPNSQCSAGDQCFAVDATEHHYTGKERDSESGLDYFGARYYGSNMGRFMSPDPLNLTEERLVHPGTTLNKYAYAADNPLKFVDPDGEDVTYFYDQGGIAGHAVLFAYNQQTGDSAIESFGPVVHAPIAPGESMFDMSSLHSADDVRSTYASLTIQTSPELAQQVIAYIRANPDPSTWFAFGPNCSTQCLKILQKFKLANKKASGRRPKLLWNSLRQQYNPNAPANPKNGTD